MTRFLGCFWLWFFSGVNIGGVGMLFGSFLDSTVGEMPVVMEERSGVGKLLYYGTGYSSTNDRNKKDHYKSTYLHHSLTRSSLHLNSIRSNRPSWED